VAIIGRGTRYIDRGGRKSAPRYAVASNSSRSDIADLDKKAAPEELPLCATMVRSRVFHCTEGKDGHDEQR
jgi:hypothetical protein